MRFILSLFFIMLLAGSLTVLSAKPPLSPLLATDLGEGIFTSMPEFDFGQSPSSERLLSLLGSSLDQGGCLRAIRDFYQTSVSRNNEAVPMLRVLVASLHDLKSDNAGISLAYTIGLSAEESSGEARALILRDLALMIPDFRAEHETDPWARLVVAMLYAAIPELKGNALDEALYAQCFGYDDPQIQLAVGSLLLLLDGRSGGNERLQWFAYLSMQRALELAPSYRALGDRIKSLAAANLNTASYRASRWVKKLARKP